ncbi:histidine phosphatase family protein [Actinomycetospora cinnamomea]|uniref:Broad specificity phosphatase PhoE n=1 Tax=Actinomycetospora cinnamomea TaxID=663609 RepID=A0A2U1FA44_9PSEU|nr:broad specificity phosphatase PhoE [Actinomycetospora cinnamomea]
MTTAGSWTGRGTTMPTRVLLLRHGQSPLSVEKRYSGRGDPELTREGLEQAAAAATALAARHIGDGDIRAVVSSPLLRARQTAEPVAGVLGLGIGVDERLTETDFGTWEGLTFAEAAQQDPEVHRAWLGDSSVSPPQGESFDVVAGRVDTALDDLLRRHPGQTVVVVSHVTPIKLILRRALDAGPQMLYRLHLDLACLSVVEFWPDGGASVRLVNDTSYLA